MLHRGICIYNTIPCREEPSHKSQLSTQLLFGETYQVLDIQGEWLLIACDHDGYQAWMWANQHTEYEKSYLQFFRITDAMVHFIEHRHKSYQQLIPVFAGSRLPDVSSRIWEVNGHQFSYQQIEKKIHAFSPEYVRTLSTMYLHTPYLWGGRSPAGMDCSGLVQVVFAMMGIALPRDAWQQSSEGELVNFIDEVQPGDLAFFDNEEGKITHVGIMLDRQTIIHASGSVRIDLLDHEGIFHSDLKKHTHRLRIIKRII